MLTSVDVGDGTFESLRRSEFSRLDERGIAYLDYAASALYGASQVAACSERLMRGVFGNPHSEHGPSRASEVDLELARTATLTFFDADPAVYDVCFTANTSMAIKLVAESYPFRAGRGLILSADNHNSMNGIREYARAAGAHVCVLPLDEDLRLLEPAELLTTFASSQPRGLFGFPAQSNFSGVRHPLDLVCRAQSLGYDVMLDAAGVGCGGGISLRRYPAEFLVFSFYKIFGLPTGVGALVARRDALDETRATVVRRRNRRFRLNRARSSSTALGPRRDSRMAHPIFWTSVALHPVSSSSPGSMARRWHADSSV